MDEHLKLTDRTTDAWTARYLFVHIHVSYLARVRESHTAGVYKTITTFWNARGAWTNFIIVKRANFDYSLLFIVLLSEPIATECWFAKIDNLWPPTLLLLLWMRGSQQLWAVNVSIIPNIWATIIVKSNDTKKNIQQWIKQRPQAHTRIFKSLPVVTLNLWQWTK